MVKNVEAIAYYKRCPNSGWFGKRVSKFPTSRFAIDVAKTTQLISDRTFGGEDAVVLRGLHLACSCFLVASGPNTQTHESRRGPWISCQT